MNKPSPQRILEKEVETFCIHCNWAYQCWAMRKYLFDENPQEEFLKHPHHIHLFIRLEAILQEYWILEVNKLHDPAVQHGHNNLSVKYILEKGKWPITIKNKLSKLQDEMENFIQHLRRVRNKLLSHKDKNTILSGKTLGSFKKGMDVYYFENLNKFANEVHKYTLGEPYIFDELIKNDIEIFMETFSKGLPENKLGI